MEFTPQEIIVTVVVIALAIIIIGFIFKTIFKIAVVASVCVLIFGIGFGWLPAQLESLREGRKTGEDLVNEVGENIENKIEEYNLISIFDGIIVTVTNHQTYEEIWNTISSVASKTWNYFFASEQDDTDVDEGIDTEDVETIESEENA